MHGVYVRYLYNLSYFYFSFLLLADYMFNKYYEMGQSLFWKVELLYGDFYQYLFDIFLLF